MSKRPTLRLKPKEGRRVRAGAPWVYSNEIVLTPEVKALALGSLVRLADEGGKLLGTGYFNAQSLIAIRMLSTDPDAQIDTGFFARHLSRALALREALFDAPFYRLVNAEGDFLPGLTIDRFSDVCTVQVGTAGMEALTSSVVAALDDVLAPSSILLRNDTPSRALEGLDTYIRAAKGEAPSRVTVEENGVRYFADLSQGQKTGWYYDQRDNRAFIAALAPGRKVLDAYCYTGGFALAAARAGASETVGIDSSQAALALAENAAVANSVTANCIFARADVSEELERLALANERFGVVICDPPPFVKAKKDLEAGARAYRKLARLGAQVTAPKGFLLLASCSHNMPMQRFAQECALGIARAGRQASIIREAGAGADHPVHAMLPENAYLKTLVYALD